MNITKFNSTGYTGEFVEDSGEYHFVGAFSCSGEEGRPIKSFNADVTTGSGDDVVKIGSFSIYFNDATTAGQQAMVDAIKAVRNTLDSSVDNR